MVDIKREFPDELSEVAMKEYIIYMPVSISKCTIGIKEYATEPESGEFLTKDLLQSMVLDHYFSKGGEFYLTLYNEGLIDDSFYFVTSLERNFWYYIIECDQNSSSTQANQVF